MKTIYIALIIFLISGCSSLALNRDAIKNEPDAKITYYAGTKFDTEIITIPFGCNKETDGCILVLIWPILGPFALIDLPLSIIADTILLPSQYFKNKSLTNHSRGDAVPARP